MNEARFTNHNELLPLTQIESDQKVRICEINKSDLPSFVDLWNQSKDVLTTSKLEMTLEKAIEGFDQELFMYLGIYSGAKLIGFILLKDNSDVLWIKHLAVDSGSLGQGYGRKLVDRAKNISRLSDEPLQVEVLEDNDAAKDFFMKNGFRETGHNEKKSEVYYEWREATARE